MHRFHIRTAPWRLLEEAEALLARLEGQERADLTEIEMLRKFQPPNTPALYETRTTDNHHHALCIGCGRVEDVDCALGEAPCLTPSESHGMTIIAADIVFRGLCAACQQQAHAEDSEESTEREKTTAPPQVSGLAPR